jgi:protease IV
VAPKYFGPQRKLAVVYVDQGELVSGKSQSYPFIGMEVVGSDTLMQTLAQVRDDPTVAAVVLRVESPGGSSLAADVIWRAVERTNEVKPVVVSMGGLAASGGYYLSVPSRRIFANPSTLTGSIGVYYGKADASELLQRVGVNIEVYKTTPRADADAVYRPFTAEEREAFQDKLEQSYDLFLTRVAAGREMKKEKVDEVAQGRVWTGSQAQARGLVDEIGGLRQALGHARALAGLPEHAPIVELPERQSSLLGALLGIEGMSERQAQGLPTELLDMARALAPFTIHAGDQPLMRLELISLGE